MHEYGNTTHLWTKKTKPKVRRRSQHREPSKSSIPSKRDPCHPSKSIQLHFSNPHPRTLWHDPTRIRTANSLTILIYRPSVLRVVGFVVWCTEDDSVFPYPGISHMFGFGRVIVTGCRPASRLDLDQLVPFPSAFSVEVLRFNVQRPREVRNERKCSNRGSGRCPPPLDARGNEHGTTPLVTYRRISR